MLVARPLADQAPSLLRSERLRQLFANARTYYDLVIIDGPPLLATADSLLLAGHADQAILIAPRPAGPTLPASRPPPTASPRPAAPSPASSSKPLPRPPPGQPQLCRLPRPPPQSVTLITS